MRVSLDVFGPFWGSGGFKLTTRPNGPISGQETDVNSAQIAKICVSLDVFGLFWGSSPPKRETFANLQIQKRQNARHLPKAATRFPKNAKHSAKHFWANAKNAKHSQIWHVQGHQIIANSAWIAKTCVSLDVFGAFSGVEP